MPAAATTKKTKGTNRKLDSELETENQSTAAPTNNEGNKDINFLVDLFDKIERFADGDRVEGPVTIWFQIKYDELVVEIEERFGR